MSQITESQFPFEALSKLPSCDVSLRDLIAIKALPMTKATAIRSPIGHSELSWIERAEEAYAIADAMLRAREVQP